jgi:hypothetical protein
MREKGYMHAHSASTAEKEIIIPLGGTEMKRQASLKKSSAKKGISRVY